MVGTKRKRGGDPFAVVPEAALSVCERGASLDHAARKLLDFLNFTDTRKKGEGG